MPNKTLKRDREKHICIYCKMEKDISGFSKEHVINQAFGLFGPKTPVLRKTVCKECNQKFGDSIDLRVARGTLEGDARSKHGIQKQSKIKKPYSKHILRVVTEAPFRGLPVILYFDESTNSQKIATQYDFGVILKDSESPQWHTLNELPDEPKEDYEIIITFGRDEEKIRKTLSKQWSNSTIKFQQPPPPETDYNVQPTAVIDTDVKRAFAKIAFNYFAYYYAKQDTSYLTHECFDFIRDFIVNGKEPGFEFFNVSTESLISMHSETRAIAHFLVIEKAQYVGSKFKFWGCVIIRLALIDYITYTIVLSVTPHEKHPSDSGGHAFDPINNQVFLIESLNSVEHSNSKKALRL